MDLGLSGKVAIVTGGAAGIGKGIVECFAREGARVVIADWDERAGTDTCAQLHASGADAMFCYTNVSQENDLDRLTEQTLTRFGQIDVLVNNVGTHFYKKMLDITTDEWDRLMQTDLRGHFLMSKKVLPYMMEQKQGSIVHISSVHAWQTSPTFTVYAAAKGGIVSMAKSMALECAPYGIRVNTILPGLTRNSGIDKWGSQLSTEEKANQLHKLAHNIPIGRIAEPQDIGEAVVFIASSRASFIIGASLAVDGGETIHLQF